METQTPISEIAAVVLTAVDSRGSTPVGFDPALSRWRRLDLSGYPMADVPGIMASLAGIVELYGPSEDSEEVVAARHAVDNANAAIDDSAHCLERAATGDDDAPLSMADAIAYARRSSSTLDAAQRDLQRLIAYTRPSMSPAQRFGRTISDLTPTRAAHLLFALAQDPRMRTEQRVTPESWLTTVGGHPWSCHTARVDVWRAFCDAEPHIARGVRQRELYRLADSQFGRPRALRGRIGWRGVALPTR